MRRTYLACQKVDSVILDLLAINRSQVGMPFPG